MRDRARQSPQLSHSSRTVIYIVILFAAAVVASVDGCSDGGARGAEGPRQGSGVTMEITMRDSGGDGSRIPSP
jgi:hypothetical protein